MVMMVMMIIKMMLVLMLTMIAVVIVSDSVDPGGHGASASGMVTDGDSQRWAGQH